MSNLVFEGKSGTHRVEGYRLVHPSPDTTQYDPVSDVNPPAKVDLRPFLTPVENQGELSSCTANAIAGAYEYLVKKAGAIKINKYPATAYGRVEIPFRADEAPLEYTAELPKAYVIFAEGIEPANPFVEDDEDFVSADDATEDEDVDESADDATDEEAGDEEGDEAGEES